MAVGRCQVVQGAHDHRLHSPQRQPQQHRAAAHPPRGGGKRVDGKYHAGQQHRGAQHGHLAQPVRQHRDGKPHQRDGGGKYAQHQADGRCAVAARMAQHRHRKAVHIPACRQQPVDKQQPLDARRGQQVPAAAASLAPAGSGRHRLHGHALRHPDRQQRHRQQHRIGGGITAGIDHQTGGDRPHHIGQ